MDELTTMRESARLWRERAKRLQAENQSLRQERKGQAMITELERSAQRTIDRCTSAAITAYQQGREVGHADAQAEIDRMRERVKQLQEDNESLSQENQYLLQVASKGLCPECVREEAAT